MNWGLTKDIAESGAPLTDDNTGLKNTPSPNRQAVYVFPQPWKLQAVMGTTIRIKCRFARVSGDVCFETTFVDQNI